MPTELSPKDRRRREARWLGLVFVCGLLAVGALVLLIRGVQGGTEPSAEPSTVPTAEPSGTPPSQSPAGSVRPDLPADLRSKLADQVTTALENASPVEHAGHGHQFANQGEVLCAADPFGMDPPGATALAEVGRVYAQHMCVVAVAGTSWEFSPRSAGPLIFVVDGAKIELPGTGDNYSNQVRELIPERYHEQALGTFADVASLEELRHRFDAAVRQ